MRSHIGRRREQNIPYKCVETRESPKRTISTSGGLGLLQMVSESDIGRCASKDASPQEGGL